MIAPTLLVVNPALPVNSLKELIALATRLPDLQQVPTFAEAGMPEYTASAWYSVHAPAKTPGEIVARLNREPVRIVNLPDIKERLKDLGSDGVGNTQEAFGQFVAAEYAKYGKLVKAMGVKPE